MTTHFGKKIRKQRGYRTHGYGRVSGGHRKSGQRGGVGSTGGKGHHWLKTTKYEPERYGKQGFKRPQKILKEKTTINLLELEEKTKTLLEEGIATKKENKIRIDLRKIGVNKLLGKGKVTKPLEIIVQEVSETALKKIEESGGTVEIIKSAE